MKSIFRPENIHIVARQRAAVGNRLFELRLVVNGEIANADGAELVGLLADGGSMNVVIWPPVMREYTSVKRNSAPASLVSRSIT